MDNSAKRTQCSNIFGNWDKKGMAGLAIAILAVAGVLVSLIVLTQTGSGQAPEESAGYTLDGDSVYWEIPHKARITVTPHTSIVPKNTIHRQVIEVTNMFGEDKTLNCGFVFDKRPRLVELYDWRSVTKDRPYTAPMNVSRTIQYKNVASVSDTELACEIGNIHNPTKKLVEYMDMATNSTTIQEVVCYYNAENLGNDEWKMDYYADGSGILYKETTELDWYDVSSALTKGQHNSKFYGYIQHTFEAGTTKQFAIKYLMNETEPTTGKRKWEVWCWDGNLQDPNWIVKLDPWSEDRNDYEFYDDSDNGADGISPNEGDTLCSHGWGLSHTSWVCSTYNGSNATARIGNMSMYFPIPGNQGSNINFTTNRTNITLQASFYDNMENAAAPYYRNEHICTNSWSGGVEVPGRDICFGLYYGAPNSSLYYSVRNATGLWGATDISRTKGWHNFTFWDNTTNSFLWIDGVSAYNFSTSDGVNTFTFWGSNERQTIWFDNVMVWNGTPSDRPTALTSANESEGDAAIDAGIASSEAAAGTNSIEQQVIIVNSTGGQTFGIFDRVLAYNNTRWLFLYQTGNENLTNHDDIAPALYVWENTSLTASQITAQVSAFINATNT